ncbi:MAG TPA: PDZ domain-containing protein, partial [Puia sp.]|nr:PDZ domain-containing protein [Puia sp.]
AKVSLADYVQPGPLGNFSASTHLQGELLGACLDFLIRDATDGHRSLDDLMREVFLQYGGKQPVSDSALETAAAAICGCGAAHDFFRNYLHEGKPIAFAKYLHLIGLRMTHDQPPAQDPQGRPLPDLRVYSWILRDDTSVRIGINNPNGCWAQAGLNTGDIITAIDDRPIHSRQDFAVALHSLRVGDTVHVSVKKETGTNTVPVYLTSYTSPVITITSDPAASAKQRRLFDQWASSAPLP